MMWKISACGGAWCCTTVLPNYGEPRSSLYFALVAFEDVVEIGGDRKRFALGRQVRGGHVDEQLVPGGVVELRLDRRGVDPGIPVEALDDAVGLHLGTGRERDEFL